MSYRYMRMLVMFDLPVATHEERKNYRKFRKFLIDEGFIMHQFSIYSKILLNSTSSKLMIQRLEKKKPNKGLVTVLTITEKQFSKMIYLAGEQDTAIGNTDKRVVFLGDDYTES